MNFTPDAAVAVAVALRLTDASPFHPAARTALHKLTFAMDDADASSARERAQRVHFLRDRPARPRVPRAIADALSTRRVLRMSYVDRNGRHTAREIEPLGYVEADGVWCLVAWCRLRDGIRAFRIDRIRGVTVTAGTPEPRPLTGDDLDIAYGSLEPLEL
ncbi:helix-turn-helix transcriptional regulator [Microbacterium suwonense]|uniref:WYL domain-containing protein n=1 Tax=Microbacterium suwonense TaxID=683047 RepID=A0ABN6X618_9MICO|nr:WYL domain-containing protein [Microbacterium suwonense]BDZ40131.1 hypothetical protein GCM10025863_27450 [Microbacterium suwonense]